MESLCCSDIVVMDRLLSSTMGALVVQVSVAVAKSIPFMLLMIGAAPNGVLECHREPSQLERLQIADYKEKQPVQGNKDADPEEDDEDHDDNKENEGEDAGEEEELSGEEGDDGDDQGDVEDVPQANGDGEGEEDDDDDEDEDEDEDDDDDEDEEEEDEEEEEEEEIPQPPAKRRK